jgi:Zn-dependent protease
MTGMTNRDSISLYFETRDVVETEFQIQDAYIREEIPTFIIRPESHLEEKIERIRAKLSVRGIDVRIRKKDGSLQIIAQVDKPQPSPLRSADRLNLPLLLFLATIITVTISGYINVSSYIELMTILGREIPVNLYVLTAAYTLSVMSILGLHELAHYLACRKHKVKTTLPLFIPGIPGISPLGTFGAIIRQKSQTVNRNELFDIGFSGPLVGFLISLIVSFLGYSWSIPVSMEEYAKIELTMGTGQSILLPALFMFLKPYIFPGQNSYSYFLHPIAIAGWLGTLLTFLNIFPIGQLDGGHVSRAVLGPKWHRRISYLMMGVMAFTGWWVMALLSIFLLRGKHPDLLDEMSPLSKKRKIMALLLIVMFIACFTLSPDLAPLIYG